MKNIKELWIGVRTRNTHEECKKFGVYSITNTVNDKIYIGSTTVDFQTRWSKHSYEMRNNMHANKFIQELYNQHGSGVFEYYILEHTNDKEKIFKIEQYYMNIYNTVYPNGYNISPIAGQWVCNSNIKKKSRKYRVNKNAHSDGGKYNFIRPYLVLNNTTNDKIRSELQLLGYLNSDIDTILSNGIKEVLSVYENICETDEEYNAIFTLCLKNLKRERQTSYIESKDKSKRRESCVMCSYFAGNDKDNNLDYCYYHNVNLPPIKIDKCTYADFGENENEIEMMRMFGRKHIDDVIEDYLRGKDYSGEDGDYYR